MVSREDIIIGLSSGAEICLLVPVRVVSIIVTTVVHHKLLVTSTAHSRSNTNTKYYSSTIRNNERFHVVPYARTVFRKIFYRAFVF